ncbi:7TM diverse intracellular signaling domain-containing protein [Winogradskyella litorisediminis]|uniref:histidine kinase n=1 Tax=Winogradskyella litorisediminis TaxID=1156618 RepID=A0ABW3N8X2_9FLAO
MKPFLLLTYIIAAFSFSQKPVFNPEVSEGKLYSYAQFTNVGKANYTIEEIVSNELLNYQDLKSENHDFGFTSDTYWIKFTLENTSSEDKMYYLETARPITDIANLYSLGKTIEEYKNGDNIPFKDRAVQDRQIVFKIPLKSNSQQDFYLKVSSDGETINLPLNLYTETAYILNNYKQQLFLGLFYGVLLLAGFIYLFFYRSLKNKAFLYYGLYVFFIALMQASLDGFVHQYFLPNGGFINSRMVLISALLTNLFLLKYCEYFLNVKLNLPNFQKFYQIIYVAISILFLMVFINQKTLEYAYPLSNLNGLLSLILILATLFTLRYKKYNVDIYFSIGIFFLVLGLLGFVMNNLGLLPSNFYTLNSSKFGTGFEVIFLSLSMTNLLRKLREQKEKSQNLALKKSEEVSELKTYFMSNMSHELRTPINAIMGLVETELADKKKSINDREKYQIIRNASLSLLSNVNSVLDFEKIEKNQIKLKNEEFNPSIVLRRLSDNWKFEAEKKGLNYSFEMDSEVPQNIIGDEDRLVQIINSVLSNAVKFTSSGDVFFKLKCIEQPENKTQFAFQISDTGVGMTDEVKYGVFDSFNQMRKDHKRNFGGIGLGLTIVKHLIKLFDGKLDIESLENKGTDVFIEIPFTNASKSVTINETDKNLKQTQLHILVVEDNKLNQMVMRKILNSFPNLSFSEVNNGQEAIDTLQNENYDIILMDLQMPIMDGYEATEIIRSGTLGEIIKNTPIIAVTADAMEETRKRVLDLGMNDYMTKPVKRELLFQKISNCVIH